MLFVRISYTVILCIALILISVKPSVSQPIIRTLDQNCDRGSSITFDDFSFAEPLLPGQRRTFEMPSARNNFVWFCGSDRRIAENIFAFQRFFAVRSTSGRVTWTFSPRGTLNRQTRGVSPPDGMITLHGWFDGSRDDFDTRTDRVWQGSAGETRTPNSFYHGEQGFALAPTRPLTDDVLPLHRWWSGQRSDNFLTSHPSWRGGPGQTRADGYAWRAVDGYAYRDPLAGLVPLLHRWNGAVRDNAIGVDARFAEGERGSLMQGYGASNVEGWVLPVPGQFDDLLDDIGHAAAPVIDRTVRVLVIRQTHVGQRPAWSEDDLSQRLFGPGYPNLADLLRVASNGNLELSPMGIVSVQMTTDLNTANSNENADDQAALRLADRVFDFRTLDADGDGSIEEHEAYIFKIISGGECASNRTAPALTLDGVRLAGVDMAGIGENEHWHVFAEEISHSMQFADLYGPGSNDLNVQASYMGDNCGRPMTVQPFLLDPWHRVRSGWLQPRLLPISRAGGIAKIAAADMTGYADDPAKRPILFFDPNRRLDEYFIVEHRSPNSPSGYDAGVISEGVAVWHINLVANDRSDAENIVWQQPWGNWSTTNMVTGGGTNMNHVYYLAADGVSEPGKGNFLSPADGELALRWSDGTDSGLRLSVLATDGREATIEWRHRLQPFRMRLDRAFLDNSNLTLNGTFRPGARLQIRADLGRGMVGVGFARGPEEPGTPINVVIPLLRDEAVIDVMVQGDPSTVSNRVVVE